MHIWWELVLHFDEDDRVESEYYSTNQTNVRPEYLSQEYCLPARLFAVHEWYWIHDLWCQKSKLKHFILNQLDNTCQCWRVTFTEQTSIVQILSADTPWCNSIAKMSTRDEWLIPDRVSSSAATLARQDCHHSFVCHSKIQYPWTTGGSTCVWNTPSLPTHRPLRNSGENTDVRRPLSHWLTPFKLKLLVSLHHLRGHHALNLQGERRGEVGGKETGHCAYL